MIFFVNIILIKAFTVLLSFNDVCEGSPPKNYSKLTIVDLRFKFS